MLVSKLFLPTLKETPREAELISHKLMYRAGMIRKLSSGIYEWLPLGFKVLKKVENIVRNELDKIGCLELFLPTLQPKDLWNKSGRWDKYGKELMKVVDRHKKEFCLGPTHEEIITDLVAKNINSYKSLPLVLYQFQSKFRDEIRPRFGVMRAREFLMKDAYSFDINEQDAEKTYNNFVEVYKKIFLKCGLNFRVVEADSGLIGGSFSHEFMVLALSGESKIVSCTCGYAANLEVLDQNKIEKESCNKCGKKLTSSSGIEIGHTFMLGTKYSKSLAANYVDVQGSTKPMVMGCYGIGISRIVAAAIEQCNDENGIKWPCALAPYDVCIVSTDVTNNKINKAALEIYESLKNNGYDVLLDDRDQRAGVKFKDMDLIGVPVRVVIGKTFMENGKVEVKIRKTGKMEVIGISDIINYMKELK